MFWEGKFKYLMQPKTEKPAFSLFLEVLGENEHASI